MGGKRHGSVCMYDAAGNEIFEMGENRQRRGGFEARIESLVNALDHFRNEPVTGIDAREDRGLALMPMMNECAEITLRLAHRPAVTGPID